MPGAVESASEHPIAQAIVDAARNEAVELPTVTGFRNVPGVGVHGLVEGRAVEIAQARRGDHGFVGRITAGDTRRPRHGEADAAPRPSGS